MKKLTPLLTLLVFAASCTKDKNHLSLPPETSTGTRLIGFEYNGALFESIRKTPGWFINTFTLDTTGQCFYYRDTANHTATIEFSGDMLVKDNNDAITASSAVNCTVRNPLSANGTFIFDTLPKNGVMFFSISNKIYTNASNSVSFRFTTMDTVAHILSGTFSGTLFAETTGPNNFPGTILSSNDSLRITEGRFDLKYRVYP